MKDIAIYGAGGFGREIACLLRQINELDPQWNLVGFFDDGEEVNSNRYGKILGNINDLNNWRKSLSVVFAMANPEYLERVTSRISNPLIDFPNLIAPNVNIFDKNALYNWQRQCGFLGLSDKL